ncbi:MAG: DNA polymerase domain-containing protein [Thermoplasmatota archaeon]
MRVPLAAYRSIVNDAQFVDVWTNGRRIRTPAPFLPYAYARERQNLGGIRREEQVLVRPLSTLEPQTWWRYEFPTVHGVSSLNQVERATGSGTTLAESHIPFLERVLVDEPAWFLRYANTDPVRFLYLDIEQWSTGEGFPTAKDPLISIGWATDEEAPQVVMGDGREDRTILAQFLAAVEKHDPDIIVGYSVDGYDLPMILKRLQANGMSPMALGRGGEMPRGTGEEDDPVVLPGRLVYDVYDSVRADQTLYGIKDLKLKTVAAWMRLPVIKEDVTNTRSLVGTDRLRRYNENDVSLARSLAKVYFPNYEALADFYGAPLSMTLGAMSTFHTTILQGRVFAQASPRIVSDGRNDERYKALYDAAEGQAFVGGIVEIYQRGLFTPLWKADFSSMYPSLLVALGCGADNTRFLGSEPLGPFVVRNEGSRRIYSIPDESRNVNLTVEIQGFSPLAEEVRRLLAERMVLKRRAQEAGPEERVRLNARQNAIKVILNSIYGVMASAHARAGSLPVAVAIVGVARHLIRRVEDVLGDAKIETDTDGVYSAKPVDAEALNAVIHEAIVGELGGEPTTRVEVEQFAAGYFHTRKSYILLHHDGRLEKHGIAFKGSSLCGVFDKTLDVVSRALLSGTEDVRTLARECFDLGRYADEDFVMRVRLGKAFDDYKAGTPIGKQIAELYEKRNNRRPERGEQLQYVKLRDGFGLAEPGFRARLDEAYYRGLVETVMERLDIDWRPTKQVKLFEF